MFPFTILPEVKEFVKISRTVTTPDVFGMHYAGSHAKRKNDIRRKHNAKYHK